jgi:hypothetical protein
MDVNIFTFCFKLKSDSLTLLCSNQDMSLHNMG